MVRFSKGTLVCTLVGLQSTEPVRVTDDSTVRKDVIHECLVPAVGTTLDLLERRVWWSLRALTIRLIKPPVCRRRCRQRERQQQREP